MREHPPRENRSRFRQQADSVLTFALTEIFAKRGNLVAGGVSYVAMIFIASFFWSVDINDVARVQRGFLFFGEASAKEQV